jgi:hypothetical protein
MNNDFIDDIEQYDDEEVDIYGDTPAERNAHINQLFGYITESAMRRLEYDVTQEENRLLTYMAIDCLAKGAEENVAVRHILTHLVGMGYFMTEEEIKETLSRVKEHCVREILAYKIAVEDVYESYAHPADVIMKVHKLMN